MRATIFIVLLTMTHTLFAQSDLEKIVFKISHHSPKKINFIETKTAFFLTQAVSSTGVFEFHPPDTLIRYLSSPEKSEQRIVGNELIINSKEVKNKKTSLDLYPELATIINAMRWLLNGDLHQLKTHFNVHYSNNKNTWTINLKPNNTTVISEISEIFIVGYEGNIAYIKILKTKGDNTMITFHE